MHFSRTIEKVIPELSELFKVLLVTGMRQVGKSALLQQLSQNHRSYANLAHFADYRLAEMSAGDFFQKYSLPIVIEEIQSLPIFLEGVKAQVGKYSTNGQIWLSSSQCLPSMDGNYLTDQLCEVYLMPLSIYEREGKGLLQQPYIPTAVHNELPHKTVNQTWQIIWQGAYPGVVESNKIDREKYYKELLQTFLEHDIGVSFKVKKQNDFRKFLIALAMKTGQDLRVNKLCEFSGVPEATVKRWLSIAEASGIIYLLRPFSRNATKTLTKSPKIYFTDTGLAAYLCGFSTPEEMQQDMNAGAFFETFVVVEILKSWRHNGFEPDLYFYRDAKKQSEIDLLIHANGAYHPVEIKMSGHPNYAMTRHFDELKGMGIKVGQGAVICNTEETRYLSDDVVAHSVWKI